MVDKYDFVVYYNSWLEDVPIFKSILAPYFALIAIAD